MYSVDATVMRPASEIIEWLQPFYNLVVGAKWIAADKGEKETALNLLAAYSDMYKTGKKLLATVVQNHRAVIDKLGAGILGYGPELTVPMFRAMNALIDPAVRTLQVSPPPPIAPVMKPTTPAAATTTAAPATPKKPFDFQKYVVPSLGVIAALGVIWMGYDYIKESMWQRRKAKMLA
jgi:hypothetical protein